MALRIQIEPERKTFLLAAGIPEHKSGTYSTIFIDNIINDTNIVDIDKQLLIDLGITVTGDILSILHHAKSTIAINNVSSTPQPFKPPSPSAKLPTLKLIICYISSGATNIAEVSSGFHQADWSNTLVIVYCYLISFLFCFICLLFYMFLARNLIVRICRRQVNLNFCYI